jgi:hypothetical protein
MGAILRFFFNFLTNMTPIKNDHLSTPVKCDRCSIVYIHFLREVQVLTFHHLIVIAQAALKLFVVFEVDFRDQRLKTILH